jgi:LysM repeat protein
MKKLFAIFFLLPLFVMAQEKIINHTVVAKESYSSIGRLYNINGRELANYNKLDYEKGLAIGQVLKVPVKKDVVVNPPAAKPEVVQTKPVVATPTNNLPKSEGAIFHTVAAKETLYGVSKKYNVTIADIKKWNNLTVDALNVGANIIVGYGNKENGPIGIVKKEKSKEEVRIVEVAPDNKNIIEISAEEMNKVSKPKTEKPQVEKTVEPTKEVKTIATQTVNRSIGGGFNGGYFKDNFTEKGGWDASKENGMAAVFKSTSGWDDGKYYCLHNTAAQGSIVKVTNNTTGKTIYAKVLDVIPDIKQNAGIIIRISNAAAAELGAGENQFDCTINYIK